MQASEKRNIVETGKDIAIIKKVQFFASQCSYFYVITCHATKCSDVRNGARYLSVSLFVCLQQRGRYVMFHYLVFHNFVQFSAIFIFLNCTIMRKRLQLLFVVKLSESMHGQIALELCHWICQVAVGCGTRFDTCYIYDCKYQSLPLSTANVGRLPHRRASLAYNAAITPTSSLSSWVATERTIMRFELLFRRHYVTTRDDVFVSPWTNVSVPSFGSELQQLGTSPVHGEPNYADFSFSLPWPGDNRRGTVFDRRCLRRCF